MTVDLEVHEDRANEPEIGCIGIQLFDFGGDKPEVVKGKRGESVKTFCELVLAPANQVCENFDFVEFATGHKHFQCLVHDLPNPDTHFVTF